MAVSKYYLHIERQKVNYAGSKAVDDCEKILSLNGWHKKDIFSMNTNKILRKFIHTVELLGLYSLPKNSMVVIQHPLYIHFDYLKFLLRLKKTKKLKVIFIIHDLESVRNILPNNEIYQRRDKMMYEIADRIICHNDNMIKFLIKCGVDEEKLVDLGIFDYLCEEDRQLCEKIDSEGEESIVIAGNLTPKTCAYIYKFSNEELGYCFNLYGVNFEENYANSFVQYKGSYDADILPSHMKGKYGLVWYGNELDSCGGIIEEYLSYINPHKVSSYIVAGLPVIISRNIGLSQFIEKNGLGIVIDNLSNLNHVINSIDKVQYNVFKQNVMSMAEKLKSGYFLSRALSECEKALTNGE